MSRAIVVAALTLALAPACAATPDEGRATPSATPKDGIEFELAAPRDQVFQRALAAFIQLGLPVVEASAERGEIRSGPYPFNPQTVTRYSVRISGSGDVSRVVLRGTLSAPALGITGEPIAPAEYGLRANPWRHLSRLARTIETQPLGIVAPTEEMSGGTKTP